MQGWNRVESEAAEMLHSLSQHDPPSNWECHHQRPRTRTTAGLKLSPLPEVVTAPHTHRSARLANILTPRNTQKHTLVPKKISLEEHSRGACRWPALPAHSKENRKKKSALSQRTIEQAPLPEETEAHAFEGADLIKYWVRHRSEERAISSLVQRIRAKRQALR